MAPPAQILLALSRTGLTAVASGEQYLWAQTALTECGFQRQGAGSYVVRLATPDAALALTEELIRTADRHGSTVVTSSRHFLGDVAEDLAAQLPGEWAVSLEVYSHPAWQEDLVPWLWDSGELTRAIQTARVPCAATLSDGQGVSLLLVERPGHHQGYVVGAYAPEKFDDNYEEPNAPCSVVVPAAPSLAARMVSDRFLPAYRQALHARRITTVASALAQTREEYETWQAMTEPFDGPKRDRGLVGEATTAFLDRSWLQLRRDFLPHAPALLERCRPAETAWPLDTYALNRLRAVLSAQPATAGSARPHAWGAKEVWILMNDGDVLLRQARAASSAPRELSTADHNLNSSPPSLLPVPGKPPPRR